ncbi:MAG: hypothetical protein M1814_000885 [Vezdaea aestivalis]|nr:MAG: hypothetical protein M1814_000885 [Vezdaea aestivalis]
MIAGAPGQLRSRGPSKDRKSSTRLISVDNILQFASEIPSGQKRGPPSPLAVRQGTRTSQPAQRLAPQYMPSRSTKVSEKLVLIPESQEDDGTGVDKSDFEIDNESLPLRDDEEALRRDPKALKIGKSYAERLPKSRRTEKLARVTAYCTASAYKLKATAAFVRSKHGARTKLYDDCLYSVYHLPLLPGFDGYRIRSSPVLKTPGGKAFLDEEIERSENRNYHEGYFEGTEQYMVRDEAEQHRDDENEDSRSRSHTPSNHDRQPSPARITPDTNSFAETFIFSYGVAVFWNFTEKQEKDILADLTFSESSTGISLVSRPHREEDFETEEFHFEYSVDIPRPRVYNDMITLRSGDHMIKLAMSHAIAQSTKLSLFEERMSRTMMQAQYIPKTLALTGRLGMKREDVVRMLGKLFMSRVEVNLSSNVLDAPNFFWDSEPTLHPLYDAVREYLEIKPRIQGMNERCQVFLDLAEILMNSIANKKMSRQTWIIIILIGVSILVTCTEVFLRFRLVSRVSKLAVTRAFAALDSSVLEL